MAGLKCEDVENVTVSVEHMSANKLNFWLSKFSSFVKWPSKVESVIPPILGFHMTSRPPCWCPKQRKGGHVDDPTKSSGNLTLLLCKCFLLFSSKNMAVDHVSENQQFALGEDALNFLYKAHKIQVNCYLIVVIEMSNL